MNPRQRGSAELIGILITLAVMAILLAIAGPSALRVTQVTNERTAAQALAKINDAEFTFAKLYGGYVAPTNLTGSLSAGPVSCSNPMLLSAADVQNPPHYTLTFTGAGSESLSNCGSVSGFSSYTITVSPADLFALRYYASIQDGLVHFSDTGAPDTTSTANVIAVPLVTRGALSTILTVNTSTGQNNGGGNSSNAGQTGNTTIDPDQGTGQWYVPASFTGQTETPVVATSLNSPIPGSNAPSLVNVSTFTVTLSAPANSNGSFTAVLIDTTINPQAGNVQSTGNGSIYLSIPGGQTTGSASGGGLTLNPSDQYVVRFTSNGGQAWRGTITWTL